MASATISSRLRVSIDQDQIKQGVLMGTITLFKSYQQSGEGFSSPSPGHKYKHHSVPSSTGSGRRHSGACHQRRKQAGSIQYMPLACSLLAATSDLTQDHSWLKD